MNVTISFGPSRNFSPGIIRVLTLQNFANSGVLSPDFETFIVAAETCFISSINYIMGTVLVSRYGTNSQLYSKILCYHIV